MTGLRPTYFRGDSHRPDTLKNGGLINSWEATMVLMEFWNLNHPVFIPRSPEFMAYFADFTQSFRAALDFLEENVNRKNEVIAPGETP